MIIIIIKVEVFAENHKGLLAVELDLNSDLWTRPLAPGDAVPGLWYSFTVGGLVSSRIPPMPQGGDRSLCV